MAALSRAHTTANQSTLNAQGHLLMLKKSLGPISLLVERADVTSVASDDEIEEADPPATLSLRPCRSARSKK